MSHQMLQLLLENESVQSMVNSNEQMIMEGADMLMAFTDVIYEEVMSNPEKFIVPGDVALTHEGIRVFTEAAVSTFADQLSSLMASD